MSDDAEHPEQIAADLEALGLGLWRVVPRAECPACDYAVALRRATVPDSFEVPAACPECGCPWTYRGRRLRGVLTFEHERAAPGSAE